MRWSAPLAGPAAPGTTLRLARLGSWPASPAGRAPRARAGERVMAPIRHLASAVPARLGPDLPCTDDPELFFAESPGGVETAKALCRECPARAGCLAGALESLGRRPVPARHDRAAQATTGTPTQDRRGCLGRTRES